MSSHYRRHARLFHFASLVYLLPCRYNEQTEQFEETIRNKLTFAANIAMTVVFWYIDTKLMSNVYLDHISPIMVIVGTIEIAVYVSIVTCTLLNAFLRRQRFIRMLNTLFRSDWLLDQFDGSEEQYYNGRKFGATMLLMLAMTCSNLYFQDSPSTCALTLTVGMKIIGVCYLSFLHRICVGAIGIRMEQLRELFREGLELRVGWELSLAYFIERFELYAAQIKQINRCFAFPLTLTVLLVVIELVYLMFDCFTILQLQRPILEGVESSYTQWVLRQLWQFIYFGIVVLVVTGCVETNKQLSETAHAVRHFDDYRFRSTRVAKQIQRFLMHNLERDVRFSVSGFFDIDYSMIHMVLSSIVTHTVILIQFDQLQPQSAMYATKLNSTGR